MQQVVPYEDDEVTRLIVDTHNAEAFAPIRSCTGRRTAQLAFCPTRATPARPRRSRSWNHPGDGAAVSKLNARPGPHRRRPKNPRGHALSARPSASPAGSSARLQPNHPTDDLAGIAASILDGLLLGSGDAVIGINPAGDNVAVTARLLRMIDALRERFQIPVQSCVLAHITTQDGSPQRRRARPT